MKAILPLLLLVASSAGAAPLVLPGSPAPAFPQLDFMARGDDGRSLAWAEGRLGQLSRVNEESVKALVLHLGPQLGLDAPAEELALESIETDEIGMRHALFFRVQGGLPVVESDLVLHFSKDGTLVSMNGSYPASSALAPLVFSLDTKKLERRALEEALVLLRRRGEKPEVEPKVKSRLVVWHTPMRHALEVEVQFELHQKWRFYVDAVRGTILRTRNLVQTDSQHTGTGVDSFNATRSLNITYFDAQRLYGTLDQTNGSSGGRLMTLNANYTQTESGSIFGSSTKTFSDKASVDVHANMRIIYDYFKNSHSRTSWDNRGADIVSVVHYGRSYANAFWNGEVMAFGDGDGTTLLGLHRCLDVAAHELTHAVIDGTVGLVYENQSGALNEHFADVFGVLVDGANWNIAEHCVGSRYPYSVMRSMSNPSSAGQPGHMNQYQSLPNTEDGDYGGVHINSGIVNKAAYLVGTQISRSALGKIWYRILSQRYLSQRSQFLDLRRAAIRACGELYPASSCDKVPLAFDQVGIVEASSGGSGCPPNSTAQNGSCYCNEGYRPNAAGTACELIPTVNCPPNSTAQNGSCYCNEGYVVNAEGTGCVLASTACPSNSHRSNGVCVCDEGYQGTPGQGYGCQPIEDECPPNSRPSSEPGYCECLPGWVVNAARDACIPGSSGCGDENYYGRCQGGTLIYCHDNTIQVIDCAASGASCGLENAEIGNNCLAPDSSPCGSLTFQGECVGNLVRWCENNEIRELDCGSEACIHVDDELGYTCDPCPANASYREGSCYCDEGFESNEAGDACVADSEPGEPQEPGEPADSDGPRRDRSSLGCATGGESAGLLLLLPLLAALRRRGLAALVLALSAVACTKSAPERVPDASEIAPAPPAPLSPVVAVDEQAPAPVEETETSQPSQGEIVLQAGESWKSEDGSLGLSVLEFVPSSLCPKGVRCVWAGLPAHALVEASSGDASATLKLFEQTAVDFASWRLTPTKVTGPLQLRAERVVVAPE